MQQRLRIALGPLVLACAACYHAPAHGNLIDDGGDPGGNPGPFDLALADVPPPPFMGAVYAHSATELFSIDPVTFTITRIGPFTFGGLVEGDAITDIALDRDAHMVGISYQTLYTIDKATAACKALATIGGSFNAL